MENKPKDERESKGEFISCASCKEPTTFSKGSSMDLSGRSVYCPKCYKPRERQAIPSVPLDVTGTKPVTIPPQTLAQNKKNQKKAKYDKASREQQKQEHQEARKPPSDNERFLRIAVNHTREELIDWIDAAAKLGMLKPSTLPTQSG